MFLCREKELSQLNNRYFGSGLECIVIYGRRRVGKTALINEFVKDKPTVYFPALKASAQDNLEALSRAIFLYENPESTAAPVYPSFDAAFSEITRISRQKRVIFVIDEFPYLVDSEGSVSSRLQNLLDYEWKDTKLFLILCGSSMSFMEKEVLSSKSPLFGRRTAQMKIEPLNFRETAAFHPELSCDENAVIYGITGGIPHYINKLDVRGNVKEALLQNFFDTSAYLYEEPQNLLRQELREPAAYNSVITAIAEGASKLGEIASKLHITTASCANYVKVLNELEIIEEVEPIIKGSGRKKIYRIMDPFFRFWYRFVPRNVGLIASGMFEKAFDAVVGSGLPDYMGQIFERMCRQYLLYYSQNTPILIGQIGEWWGNDRKKKKEIQLDIVAEGVRMNQDEVGRKFIIGSCKYRNSPVDASELNLIRDYAAAFTNANDRCYYYIFSKTGFTEQLKEVEKRKEVRLVLLDEMYM